MPSRPSRRHFLQSASLALLGVPAALAQPRRRRAAVIGHTGRGDYGHGWERIFQDRPGVELVGLADPDPSGRARTAAAIGAPRAYADHRDLLAQERPELVSLAMRHADQHRDILLDCLRAGAHCYVEKPFTRTPAEADEVLAEAAGRGLQIAVAHTLRLSREIRRLHAVLREGGLGDLREMRAWGKQDARAGGEDLMVLGTHLFDLMRLFAGDPEWVTARVLWEGRDITPADRRLVKDNVGWVAGDQVFAQFGFPGGVHATFTSDGRLRESAGNWGIELHGSRGVARINNDVAPNVFLRRSTTWSASGRTDEWKPLEPAMGRLPGGFRSDPVADWLEAIEQGRDPECSGRNGAWAVEMVAGVYHAALERTRVPFPLKVRTHPLAP